MPNLALFGFPNVGKTTLFNAITGLEVPTGSHPFSTVEPTAGVARVPDPQLERLAEVEGSARAVHATLDLLDLPPMAGGGEGRGDARLLGRLREVDALLGVLRAFDDPSVPMPAGEPDPVRQAEELSLELMVADLESLERRLVRLEREATSETSKHAAVAALGRAVEALHGGVPLRSLEWSGQERGALRDSAPLTLKPTVWVVNAAEEETDPESMSDRVMAVLPPHDVVEVLSLRLEEEGSRLDPADRRELFDGLGLGEGALARVVRAVYGALELITFYTAAEAEAHAWTVRRGVKAPEAAGRIHSDLERGFIRVEVVGIEELLEAGGWDDVRRAGLVRVEGRDYVVEEGDVLHVRFSV